jgi:putative transcriptional regulator
MQRILLALAPLLAAILLVAAAPKNADTQAKTSLAGQLLIASPELEDPHFAHTVILLVRHDETGALGIIINRPVAERSLITLLEAIGIRDSEVTGNVQIFAGGPVQRTVGFILHDAAYHRRETVAIDGHVAMTSSPEVLRDMGHQKGPAKALVAFGYAGWGPGQLESEMAHNDWFTMPEEPKIIFDEERDKVWDDAMARHPRDL